MTEEIHEGTIVLGIWCRNPNDSEYLCDTNLDQEQFEKFNLKVNDIVQYKIDKDGSAEILGKVHIEKTIETLA